MRSLTRASTHVAVAGVRPDVVNPKHLEMDMPSFSRKGIRRRGSLRRASKKTAGRVAVRLAIRLTRPFAPGILAGAAANYFIKDAAGNERRKKALSLVGGLLGRRSK